MNYLIDPYVLKILKGLDSEEMAVAAFNDYIDTLSLTLVNLLETYLENKGVEKDLLEEFMDNYSNFLEGETNDSVGREETDIDALADIFTRKDLVASFFDRYAPKYDNIKDYLMNGEYKKMETAVVEKYNENFYVEARKSLSEDDKAELNNYLKSINEEREKTRQELLAVRDKLMASDKKQKSVNTEITRQDQVELNTNQQQTQEIQTQAQLETEPDQQVNQALQAEPQVQHPKPPSQQAENQQQASQQVQETENLQPTPETQAQPVQVQTQQTNPQRQAQQSEQILRSEQVGQQSQPPQQPKSPSQPVVPIDQYPEG